MQLYFMASGWNYWGEVWCSLRDGWELGASLPYPSSGQVCTLVLLLMSHHANGSTHTSNAWLTCSNLVLLGHVNPNLTHPILLMPTDCQSTSIVQWNMRSHQQLQLMNLLPHPLHTLAWHCIPGASPSLRLEVINVRGKLGNISHRQDIRHAEMVQHESEIEQTNKEEPQRHCSS